MLNIVKCSLILLSCQFVFSQHYDVGYNTDYQAIKVEEFYKTKLKVVEFEISASKKVKKVFSQDHKLLEELVFVDEVLVSGVEYFCHPTYPFLNTPRSFQIQNIERTVADYQNVKFTSSLIKYIPKLKKGVFKVRLYNDSYGSSFYLLETNQGLKMYFQ